MPQVFIDGETVMFEGALPGTLGELRDLLERALAENGRVLAALAVGGRDYAEADAASPISGDTRVEAVSVSLAEARARVAAVVADELERARAAADLLAEAVLRVPWEEAQGQCIRAAEMMSHVLQGALSVADGRQGDDPVAVAAGDFARGLERWMDAVQARDAAAVCLRSDDTVLPALARLGAALARSGAAGTKP